MGQASGTPKDAVVSLMVGAVPERSNEIYGLWKQYNPEVILVSNAKRLALEASGKHIAFDFKTPEVFWLLGFGGWKAIECYTPSVIASIRDNRSVADLLAEDADLGMVEWAYKTRRSQAQALIDTVDIDNAPWPEDIPRPSGDRNAVENPEYKAAFDLSLLALAYALFHEFKHVMLDQDDQRPSDRREEELACDVWARDFMTAKVQEYASDNGHEYNKVLRKRAMGFALAALILHEITPQWEHGGNDCYFSVASRIETIILNTPLPDNDHFWVFMSSLLIGILRQKSLPIDAPPMGARKLAEHLIGKI